MDAPQLQSLFSEDSVDLAKTADGFIDHNLIYEQLQERFSRAYSLSQKLFVTEKTQRQALYHYKRRVNALLDVLQDMEGTESADVDQPLEIDHSRLTLLITWRPELASTLNPVLQLAAGTDSPAQIPLKRSYAVNLVVEELIPEIANDELDAVEINPQNTEMWIRRNLLHLIMSKFTPAEVTPKGVREYLDPLPIGSKRKKRS
ncbi:hypothetical protein METBIDRAFT_88212 [Metschnikowia bicuspidata var. bicuspidata NRRL YB-4993]|uniref:Uncharacterized protein n=1 Tax=Metschnikowia bicuspidata var. bicuspidata NRRL YB-4993 TaxID=869754 RepID=A0A1A0H9Z2_9ASCO|nr:hypothetical protein METBIDRAFT_88212 [Metschnikowia bicuspidata var. bicuspidata NRRL YB-4993]OBA20820.1 hypothetical protein METBIDRAFT_88212 [Metschnikowia bicuspidata var. bicuspidata NRRL YB-4993]